MLHNIHHYLVHTKTHCCRNILYRLNPNRKTSILRNNFQKKISQEYLYIQAYPICHLQNPQLLLQYPQVLVLYQRHNCQVCLILSMALQLPTNLLIQIHQLYMYKKIHLLSHLLRSFWMWRIPQNPCCLGRQTRIKEELASSSRNKINYFDMFTINYFADILVAHFLCYAAWIRTLIMVSSFITAITIKNNCFDLYIQKDYFVFHLLCIGLNMILARTKRLPPLSTKGKQLIKGISNANIKGMLDEVVKLQENPKFTEKNCGNYFLKRMFYQLPQNKTWDF
eukprot:TRINITY_DN215_c0_g1_i10.p1 TRINITY_DN215_c0_g1~~TRINITY_DN215_c0_g1_i10.p1  ORF type:complete len:281 (-),score=-7.24 TRINITY_DN215_c0_g1_i10:248-1090(-)